MCLGVRLARIKNEYGSKSTTKPLRCCFVAQEKKEEVENAEKVYFCERFRVNMRESIDVMFVVIVIVSAVHASLPH